MIIFFFFLFILLNIYLFDHRRNLFAQDEDTSAESIAKMVLFVRRQTKLFSEMSSQQIFDGNVRFLKPLEVEKLFEDEMRELKLK